MIVHAYHAGFVLLFVFALSSDCTYIFSLCLYPYQRINYLLKTCLSHVVEAVNQLTTHADAHVERVLLRGAECHKRRD